MRIAINCRSILLPQRTGIGRYTFQLLDSLGKLHTDDTFTLYAPQRLFDVKRNLPEFPYRNFHPQVDHFHKRPLNCDIFHIPSPGDVGNFEGHLVVTVHDLIAKAYPQGHTPETIEMTQKHMEQIVKRADRVICVSENTRQDLHRFFDFPVEKSVTVLNGVDHSLFYHMPDLSTAQSFLEANGLMPGFLLFVGTIEPRKNLKGLLQAMAELKRRRRNVPVLVVAGMKGWGNEDPENLVAQLGLKDYVLFMGYVNDQQLNFLYNACGAFVFPSFYEGFGFPIVEAFCTGTAVIASKTACGPEIAGDAALLIDPLRPEEIADAITKIDQDQTFTQQLRTKALARAGNFSFEKTARQTLGVYHDV